MKYFVHAIITLLILSPLVGMSQQSNTVHTGIELNKAVSQQLELHGQVDFTQKVIPFTKTNLAESVIAYYQTSHPFLQTAGVEIQLVHQTQSRMGEHFLFQQHYNGIPIWGATLKVNITVNGTTLSVFDKLVSTSAWEVSTNINQTNKMVWVPANATAYLAIEQTNGELYQLTDMHGNQIYQRTNAFNFQMPDTPSNAWVFLPDPLTPQSVIYGQNGTYQHFGDSDYALINDAREQVTLPVTFANGNFLLRNQYARLVDLRSPAVAPAVSATPDFNFLRSQTGFKDVMALYHITSTQEYFQYLGFNQLKFYQLKVDAHSGVDDNSSFNFGDTSLNFGGGGVPDAEDGDVISHEYTHALSFFINPSPNMSSERRAIEEAMCDVIAAIQSKKYTEFNWRKLFNWDGPNPRAAGVSGFWGGRDGASTKTYANYTGNPYRDCEIWTSTLLDISNEIGVDSTALLMLETIASMTESTTMPQAATLFMQADSLLLGSYFSWKMGRVFNERGLGNFPTSIQSARQLEAAIAFTNTLAFANGTGAAFLDLSAVPNAKLEVFNLQGQLVYEQNNAIGNIALQPEWFSQGMYLVQVSTNLGTAQFKLLRSH